MSDDDARNGCQVDVLILHVCAVAPGNDAQGSRRANCKETGDTILQSVQLGKPRVKKGVEML
jgi:hypothetical protein